MKKLIITRGLPGSGKSTVISELGLNDFTISSDSIRLLYSSLEIDTDGKFSISKTCNDVTWSLIRDLIKYRLSNGITTVIDAVNCNDKLINEYITYADLYGYEVALLDFSDIPFNIIQERNSLRNEEAIVSNCVLEKFKKDLENQEFLEKEFSNKVRIIKVYNNDYQSEVKDFLSVKLVDLSHYEEIVHIGDIQGCFEPLSTLFKDGISDNKFYIFTGDLCDRGEQNGEVLRFILDNFTNKNNIIKIIGNHEYHLFRELYNLKHKSDEFISYTKNHLNNSLITKEDLSCILNDMKDCFYYQYRGKRVFVTHGGVGKINMEMLWKIPSRQFEKGVGNYNIKIDEEFNLNSDNDLYQVHGHRNKTFEPMINNRSINLEGSVEYGGKLRVAILNQNGFHEEYYSNSIIRAWKDRLNNDNFVIPLWMSETENNTTKISKEMLDNLINHKGVVVRNTSVDNIISVNFTKKVFYNKEWDDIVVKARGLFINTKTYEIVSRSYDKFFNINELPNMDVETLSNNMSYPISFRNKENGFLGIVGYNKDDDSLFISTKGNSDGEFALLFKDIFYKTFNEQYLFRIKNIVRDFECSLVFEVIEPNLDPHLIKYDKPKIILLDMIRRSMNFEKLDYIQLKLLANKLNVELSEKEIILPNKTAFISTCNKILNDSDFKYKNEGYVLMDNNGYMVKIKTPYYSFWKLMRSHKDYLLKQRRQKNQNNLKSESIIDVLKNRGLGYTIDLCKDFNQWCNAQSDEVLMNDIIQLREMFLNQK